MKKILFLALAALFAFCANATIITTSPKILQESSQNVVLTYHADSPLGNNGLKGVTSSTPVYAHIGVVTNKSNGGWVYAPSKWGDNSDKYKLNYKSTNTWELTLGDMRTYFGITDASEHIEKIAIVMRTGDLSKEGKTASGGDIFVEVVPEGFQMIFSTDATSQVLSAASTLNFEAVTSKTADIVIAVDGTNIATGSGKTELTASYKFSNYGNYNVTATAKAGNETITKTLTISYPRPSTAGTYPGGTPKMGAVRNSDGTVTFCIAAPNKNSVVLVPSWDDYQILDKNIMKYQDYNGYRYFWVTISGLKDDVYYPYYFLVDGSKKVSDPYARLVLDCYSDKWLDSSIWPGMPKYPYDRFDDVILAVYRGDMSSDFKFDAFTIPAKDDLVIYELLLRDFTGTEGKADANGTINAARKKIEYLKLLGVNAVELMPVMEFNGNNSWGYNTNFYFALDKAYGSPRDLKCFVNECHKAGIAVILDIVFNQSDGLHPWYQMYSIDDNPFYNKTAPHAYSVLNDWKQENPVVRQQWKDCLQMWLKDYNVDGFRFDLVKGLGTSYGSNTDTYNKSRVDVMKDLHAAIKAVKPDAIHINENLAQTQEENEMAADGQLNWANINYNSCQYAMGVASGANLSRFLSTSDGSRTAFSTVAYAESHDEERVAYKQKAYGATAVKGSHAVRMQRLGQLAIQMLLTPGPKMIWQFGELGDEQTTKDSNGGNNTNPKVVNWSYLDDADRAALLQTYKAMCHLRSDNPELFTRTASFNTTGFGDNVTTMRTMRLTSGNKEIVAYINPIATSGNRNVPATVSQLTTSNAKLIVASKGFTPNLSGSGSSIACVGVPAHGYAVYATSNVAGVDDIVADTVNGSNVVVTAEPGRIVITGEYANAAVYNMMGQLQGSLDVEPGLYIVKVDGYTQKVLVP